MKGKPEEVLAEAEAYMVGKGYSVEVRTPNSITFYVKPKPTLVLSCLSILLGGFPFIAYVLVLTLVKHRSTLAGTQRDGGTEVTVSGQEEGRRLLEEWAAERRAAPR